MAEKQAQVVGHTFGEDLDAEGEPMTQWTDFERSHEEACAEEGHLLHIDDTGTFCLRCPYVEEAPASA
jgi:hypothetical protein